VEASSRGWEGGVTTFRDVSYWLDHYAEVPEFLIAGLVPASATLATLGR